MIGLRKSEFIITVGIISNWESGQNKTAASEKLTNSRLFRQEGEKLNYTQENRNEKGQLSTVKGNGMDSTSI